MTKKGKGAVSAAADTIALIRKKFGASSAVLPGKESPLSEVTGVIPCGIDVVDHYLLGKGGLAKGRVVEMFSDPGVAKTSFAWTLLGACQAQGGIAIYNDTERSFDVERASVFGVNPDTLILLQMDTLEDQLEQMEFVLHNLGNPCAAAPVCLVWDSLAEAQYAGDAQGYHKEAADTRAKKINQWCRRMAPMLSHSQAVLLVVNQTRQKRGVMFGSKTTTPGGDGLKYVTSARIELFSGSSVKDDKGLHIGKAVTFLAVKTRFSPPFRKVKVRLDYAQGWNNLWSTVYHAKEMKLIPPGSKYDIESYRKAVEALGWPYREPTEMPSSGGLEESVVDDGGAQ